MIDLGYTTGVSHLAVRGGRQCRAAPALRSL